MTDLLSIGASGVRAFQNALTTTSENIANSGVAGYSRRTASMAELSVAGVRGINGYGVVTTGTARAADAVKSAAVRDAGTDLARTQAGSVWLDRVQSALTGADLSTRITSFYTSVTALAADPSSTAQRSVMLENATSLASGFSSTSGALAQVMADLDTSADQDAASLTTLGQSLAKVNDGLGRVAPGSAGSANLLDQRDQILEQMSGLADVSTSFDAAGRATVKVGGSGGPTLVTGSDAGSVSYARSASGSVSLAVTRKGESQLFQPSGGSLAGIADAAGRIADSSAALDDLARTFVAGVNDVQSQGDDLTGKAGSAMFAASATNPAQISVTLTDPAGIAAASRGGGTRDASNLVKLQATRSSGGYESKVTGLVAGNAAAITSRKTVADAQNAILEGATSARDSASGVNLDNEAVSLLRFQQAYQASSRVIQVAKDTFQSILEIR